MGELSLAEMQAMVTEVNLANGWFDRERSFGDDVALLHSEVSEMFEAFRDWGVEDMTSAVCPQTDDHADHLCKPEGVGSEAADVLVRLLDTCERYGLNLEIEFRRKVVYNRSRGFRHGGKRV